MLIIKGLTKKFAALKVLDGIDLSVKKGQIIGLAGSSGSGKSTLLRCIKGLADFNSGTIKCDVEKGFMLQDFQLFPHMTVMQNLIYADSS